MYVYKLIEDFNIKETINRLNQKEIPYATIKFLVKYVPLSTTRIPI